MEQRLTARRVLLVDDDLSYRRMVEEFLTLMGYAVTSAENGSRAYEQIRTHVFDIVLLDLNMPKMDGIETVKAIRQRQPMVKIVLASGEGDSKKLDMAMANGADSLLRKPFGVEALLRHIQLN